MKKITICKTVIIVLSIVGNIMTFPTNDLKDNNLSNEDKMLPESSNNLPKEPNYDNSIDNKNGIQQPIKLEPQSSPTNENNSSEKPEDASNIEIGSNSSEKGQNITPHSEEDSIQKQPTMTKSNNVIATATTATVFTNISNNNKESSNTSKSINDESPSNTKNNFPQSSNTKSNSSNTISDDNNDNNRKKSYPPKHINKSKNNNYELNDTKTEKDNTFDFILEKPEENNHDDVDNNVPGNDRTNYSIKARRVIYVSGVLMGVVLFFIVGNFVLKVNRINDNETKTERSLDLESFDSIQLRAGDLDSLLSLETMEQYSKNSEAFVIEDNKKKNIAKIYEIKRFKDVIFKGPTNVFKNDSLFGVSMDESESSRSIPSYGNSS